MATNNSVRDHSQRATILPHGDFRIDSYIGREKISSYVLSRIEWETAGRFANPNYSRRELVKSRCVGLRYEDGYLDPLGDRIVDAQISAILQAIKDEEIKNGKKGN